MGMLVALVKSRKEKPFVSADEFNRLERELGHRPCETGQQILSDEFAKADIDAETALIGGVEHRRVLRGADTCMTTEGLVTVTRSLFRDHSDPGAKTVPAPEVRIGSVAGSWTPEAAKRATWVVSQTTSSLVEEFFKRFGTMRPSKSSLDRLPKETPSRWESDLKHFEAELREVTTIPGNASTNAVSIDGVLAPMGDGDAVGTREQTAAEERMSKPPAGYRDIGCTPISFCVAELLPRARSRSRRRLAQAVSLGLGLPTSLLDFDRSFRLAPRSARLARTPSTQASLVLAPA